MRYRKIPLIIEAFAVKDCEVTIVSKDGTAIARDGDWIVRGIHGELYPVSNEVFSKSYQVVEDA